LIFRSSLDALASGIVTWVRDYGGREEKGERGRRPEERRDGKICYITSKFT
jgi:hypothetical protein